MEHQDEGRTRQKYVTGIVEAYTQQRVIPTSTS